MSKYPTSCCQVPVKCWVGAGGEDWDGYEQEYYGGSPGTEHYTNTQIVHNKASEIDGR